MFLYKILIRDNGELYEDAGIVSVNTYPEAIKEIEEYYVEASGTDNDDFGISEIQYLAKLESGEKIISMEYLADVINSKDWEDIIIHCDF